MSFESQELQKIRTVRGIRHPPLDDETLDGLVSRRISERASCEAFAFVLRMVRFDGVALFVSIIAAAMSVIGNAYRTGVGLDGLVGSLGNVASTGASFLLCAVPIYLFTAFMLSLWDEHRWRLDGCDGARETFGTRSIEDIEHDADVKHLDAKQRRRLIDKSYCAFPSKPDPIVPVLREPLRLLAYAGIIFLFWLIYIIGHYPGTMRDDTIPQLLQWLGVIDYYVGHPFLDTFVFGAFWSFGDSVLGDPLNGLFLFIVVQALLTSLAFAAVIVYMERVRAPRVFSGTVLAFIALMRVFYQPVDAMSKDSLNGIVFIVFAMMLAELIRTRGHRASHPLFLISFTIVSVLCMATKSTMPIIIPLTMLVVVVFYVVRHRSLRLSVRHITSLVAMLAVPYAIFAFAYTPAVNQAVGLPADAENGQNGNAITSVVSNAVARTVKVHPDALSDDEYALLDSFMDVDAAVSVYNPTRSDEVNGTIRHDADRNVLLDMAGRLMVREPATMVASFLAQTGGWFDLSMPMNFGHDMTEELLNDTRIDFWADNFFEGDRDAALDALDDFFYTPSDMQIAFRNQLEKIDASQIDVMPGLCSHAFYAFVVPLIVLAYGASRRRLSVLMGCVLPLVVLASLLTGPMVLYWYGITPTYIAPIVIAIPFIVAGGMDSKRRVEHADDGKNVADINAENSEASNS